MSNIVSLLWPKFGSVLDSFVKLARPAVVYTRSRHAGHSPDYRAAAASIRVRVEGLDELLPPAQYQALSAGASIIAERLISRVDWDDVEEQHDILGMSEGGLRHAIASVAYEQAYQAVLHIEELNAAAMKTSIDLIVVNEDYTAGLRAVAQWGRARSIPVLHVAHGCALTSRLYTNHRPFISDIMAMPGERAREPYREFGISNERLPITGNPTFDAYPALVESRDSIRSDVLSQLGLPSTARIVLFATTWSANLTAFCDPQWHERTFIDVVTGFNHLLRQVPDAVLLIKDRPHPSGAAPAIVLMEQLAANLGLDSSRFRFVENHLPHCIIAAEAVVSVDSNVSIEAILAHTIPINLWTVASWLGGGPNFRPEDGVVESTGAELGTTLAALFQEPDLRAQVLEQGAAAREQFQFANDGRAAERIAALMKQLCRTPVLA